MRQIAFLGNGAPLSAARSLLTEHLQKALATQAALSTLEDKAAGNKFVLSTLANFDDTMSKFAADKFSEFRPKVALPDFKNTTGSLDGIEGHSLWAPVNVAVTEDGVRVGVLSIQDQPGLGTPAVKSVIGVIENPNGAASISSAASSLTAPVASATSTLPAVSSLAGSPGAISGSSVNGLGLSPSSLSNSPAIAPVTGLLKRP